ncbi:MAG: acyltransferase family protein [Verrucomicrobiaceae bacterium]|nr:acyltransferase family protein [Verrucomicrobiaceae bacterium]
METGRKRHEWIDLLRGIAVVGMVWTHVANTFLDGRLQGTQVFQDLTFYHGLVSPLFFWVAGYVRGMSAAKPGPRRPPWSTMKRLLLILAAGYVLHIPWEPLLKGDFSPWVIKVMCQCDVLQSLAVSCLLLLAVGWRPWQLRSKLLVVLGMGVAVLLCTQYLPPINTGFLPLDAFLSPVNGSLFPLLPWMAFACAGFLVGATGTLSWRLFMVSALAAFALPHVPKHPDVISFFFERLGWVIMIAVAVMKGALALRQRYLALPEGLLLAGRTSLCVYITHLILIYWLPIWEWARVNSVAVSGTAQGPALSSTAEMTCSWVMTLGIFAAVTTVSLGVARMKEWRILSVQASPIAST